MGELGYLLGHPCYPKLYERGFDQAVGFTNRVNTGWFSIGGGQVPIGEYAVLSCYLKAGDYIDRVRYYYLDKGQYHYLDRVQYNLLGGLGYSFGRPYNQRRYDWGFYQFGTLGQGLPQEKLVALRQCIERIWIDKPAGSIKLAIRLVPVGNLQATQEFKASVQMPKL